MKDAYPTAFDVGERLKAKRTDLGIYVRHASAKTGISPQTIYDIENGYRYPGLDILFRLCKLYHADPADIIRYVTIFGGDEDV